MFKWTKLVERIGRLIRRRKRSVKLNYDYLQKILSYIGKDKLLDDLDLKDCGLTTTQYNDLFEALHLIAENENKIESVESPFIDLRAYFILNEVKFTWRLLIGQGAACQLIGEYAWIEKVPFKEGQAIELQSHR